MVTKKSTVWILVCDGARGRIFVNRGRGTGLSEIESAEAPDARVPTRALGADRPGRTHDASGDRRHAMEPLVDWHKFEKERFAKEMAGLVNSAALENKFDRVILVAPPRVLGNLRQALNAQATAKIGGEIGKDLTQVGVHDLGPHLSDVVTL
jgi:protein required for attachment to host cells